MKKWPVFFLILLFTPVISGIYGILHDQLTYTISPEYYTKFKFQQFGLSDNEVEAVFPNPRFHVSIVGVMATWWVGVPIGLVLGLVGLLHANGERMFYVTSRAIALTMVIAFITGIVGLLYGKFFLAVSGVSWWLPDNLIYRADFIAVGSMHNFSYLGGFIGLIVAVYYSLREKRKNIVIKKLSPVIQPNELKKLLSLKRIILLDVRVGAMAEAEYKVRHVAGALWVDLNTSLAEIPTDFSDGGRHPLPSLERFALLLANLGISANSHVVVYDDKSCANAAARCWWMLRAAGVENVQVLNGGLQAAEKIGLPMRAGIELAEKCTPQSLANWQLPIVSLQDVKKMSSERAGLIIDVRDAYRYLGESEPIDLVAGHIPGAINIPFSQNLDSEGCFLSPEILKDKYENVLMDFHSKDVVVHCGSGVTACHTLLAIDYAGLPIPALYVGSWSEWSRCDLPMLP
jgi:thiosulfate/3-mercaptopyruvate sulfurtransferase